MKWRHKALFMRTMAAIGSETAYRLMQRAFGRLSADPMARIPTQIRMAKRLSANGQSPEGKILFEVGTGNMPVVPIGFFLTGAAKIITVDLNPRLDAKLSSQILLWLHTHRDEVHRLYSGLVPEDVLDERLDIIGATRHDIFAFFKAANIEHKAPFDAAATDLDDDSIDIHYSVKTLEHVPEPDIIRILKEARRLIRPSGVAYHLIDLSDHFSHQDPSISAINFLCFTEQEWLKIAGNKYGYINRLRASQFDRMFRDLNFDATVERTIDERSLAALQSGLPVDTAFAGLESQDICTTFLDVILSKPSG